MVATHAFEPDSAAHQAWLLAHGRSLLAFPAPHMPVEGGFYWLDERGEAMTDNPILTWVSARMAHVYYLASLSNEPGAFARASHSLGGLRTNLRDADYGGWFEQSPPSNKQPKAAYTHAFVLLAASTAVLAGDADGRPLQQQALEIIDRRFWDAHRGLASDEWNRDWSIQSDYRGLNGNMHMTEAFLAAGDTGMPELYERAVGICRRVIDWASELDWRIPEHFDADWQPLPNYNADKPNDAFKPYGSTPGHGFEWSRLIAQASLVTPPYQRTLFREAANEIYDRARADGWSRDGYDGFVYTVDWDGRPVVDLQLAWVAAEAVAAADALRKINGRRDTARDYGVWWEYIASTFIDDVNGSWVHELTRDRKPSSTLWVGKPDLYHAYQASVLPRHRPFTSVAGAVAVTRGGSSAP